MENIGLGERIRILQATPLFAGIEDSKLKLLAFAATVRDFAGGERLFVQGGAAERAYIIVAGEVLLEWRGADGASMTTMLRAGEIVGDIALLAGVPSLATITARGALRALALERDVFIALIEEYPQVSLAIIREMGRILCQTTERLQAASAALGTEDG